MFLFLCLHYQCSRVGRRRRPAGGGLNLNKKSKCAHDYAMNQPNIMVTIKRVLSAIGLTMDLNAADGRVARSLVDPPGRVDGAYRRLWLWLLLDAVDLIAESRAEEHDRALALPATE